MSVPDYHLGADAKVQIGTVQVKGLNAMKIPGITRKEVEVEEFGRDFDFTVPTSASWEKGSISGNYVREDTTGQVALRQKLFDNDGLANLRLYEDEDDFWAPDLANDANSLLFVMNNPGPEFTKSGLLPYTAELLVQGLLALFTAHTSGTGTNYAFVAGVDPAISTITDSAAAFVTDGFVQGQTIIIEGSTSNDTVTDQIITIVAAGTLTLTTTEVLASEAGIDGTVIHGGRLGTA